MNRKYIRLYFIIVCIVSIALMIPIVYLAKYNHFSADDYNYAIMTHKAWLDTHSIGKVIGAAIQTAKDTYYSWQGTYTSCFLFSFQPGIFGERWYALTTIIMLTSIWGGNFLICLYVLPKLMGLREEKLAFISMWALVSSYMVLYMPSPVQGLYWYNGSVHYTFFYLPLMALISVYYGLHYSKSKRNLIFKTAVGVLVGIIVAGGNFVSALLVIVIGFVALTFAIWLKKKHVIISTSIIQLFTLAGFLISVTAPGNEVRKAQEATGTVSPLVAILRSIEEGILHINSWMGFHMLVFMVLLIPILVYLYYIRVKNGKHWEGKIPVWFSVLSFGLLFSMFTPSIYAMNMPGSDRILNLIWYVAVILVVINAIYYLGYISNRWIDGDVKIHIVARKSSLYLVATIFIIFLAIGLEGSTSAKAIKCIVSGEGKKWHAENNERVKMYTNGENEDMIVSPYATKPELLFFSDLSEDKDVWPNTSLAEFYGIGSVKLYHE